MDLLTKKLPDEIWVKIFDRVPSLKDQLKVERVSKRFQSCLLALFEMKPLSLVIHLDNSITGCYGYVNESRIRRPDQMLDAVQMLANKAKLKSIESRCGLLWTGLDSSFATLINSKLQPLDRMTRFELCYFIPNPALFLQVLAKCTMLSCLKMGRGTYVQPELNLTSALSGKALTRLELRLGEFPQEQLVGLLQSLKPNVLNNVKFDCVRMSLDPVALINDLRIGAWAALEEIELGLLVVEMQLSDLFESLSRLPNLRKCKIELHHPIEPDNQFVSALTSLFSSPIETTLVARSPLMPRFTSGCQFVYEIRQVQKHHPMLEIGFEMGSLLKISLDHVSFDSCLSIRPCNNANCMACSSLYPTLLSELARMAYFGQADAHLHLGKLYRCKIGNVVEDLNRVLYGRHKAVAVEINDNLATITFRSELNHHQFNITVGCGCCLSFMCFKCIR